MELALVLLYRFVISLPNTRLLVGPFRSLFYMPS